jgi:exopolyphosphatase/guanosine-5'-triphosphate,3'-diphosphate pyrophosphatase
MPSPAVAVLDIGSNSIKVLVAARDDAGHIVPVHSRSLDARISAGISAAAPRLGDEGIARGLAAIKELLASAAPFAPARTLLVATSAVRDAANSAEFRALVQRETGHAIRILTGEEEANGIGRGLLSDPALDSLRDFHVFDLGGGSLECLAFRDRRIKQSASLPLGCVRLTERFVSDATAPFAGGARRAISEHVRATLAESGFIFNLPGATGVGTGGTVATIRAIHGARIGRKAEDMPALVPMSQLHELLDFLAPMPLDVRRRVPGLPPARADVFPTALTTILAVAETAGLKSFQHSFHNLRFGLAAELLDERF